MYRPDAGTIAIDGLSLADIAPGEWAERSAGGFQDFARLQFLVKENVGVGDLPRNDDVSAVSDAA